MARALEITETTEGATHVLALAGRLDTNTASQLDVAASRLYAARPLAEVVVDLAECAFVSSAGLRVIVTMQKRATQGGSLTFRNVTPEVMEVFISTGFDRILTFE